MNTEIKENKKIGGGLNLQYPKVVNKHLAGLDVLQASGQNQL